MIDLVDYERETIELSQVLWLQYDAMNSVDYLRCFSRLKDYGVELPREERPQHFEFSGM